MKRSTLAQEHRRPRIAFVDAVDADIRPVTPVTIPHDTTGFTARGHSWLHRRRSSLRRSIVLKHAADRVVAFACLVIALPIMAVIALAVRMSSRGPVLYREPRLGQHGREFEMLKFRTMTGSPEADGEADRDWIASQVGRPATAGAAVDRTTRIGRLLRRLSLDELPQLLNVLRGDMSIVGPRPERAAVARLFMEGLDGYVARHRMKPGITGWAQVRGLRGPTSLEKRVECDNFYIDNWSVWMDLKVLLLTAPAMIRGTNDRR